MTASPSAGSGTGPSISSKSDGWGSPSGRRRSTIWRLTTRSCRALLVGGGESDRAGHVCPTQTAVPVGHLVQVLLVVVLGVVEGTGRRDLGGDVAVPRGAQLLLEHLPGGFGRGLLLVAEGIDRGAVLGPDVVALAHALGRIVVLPEDAQHLLVAGLGRVEHDEDGLGVPGAPRADLLVGGVGRDATGVAHRGGVDAIGLPELALRTPEAAHPEHGLLQPLGEGRMQRMAEHRVTI